MLFTSGQLRKYGKYGTEYLIANYFFNYKDKDKLKQNLKLFYDFLKDENGEIHTYKIPRNKIAKLKGFPVGLDMENVDLVKITPESFTVSAGGDWQDQVNITMGNVNGKVKIINVYDSVEKQKGIGSIIENITSMFKEDKAKKVDEFYTDLKKSLKDTQFEAFKKKIIDHLDKLEKEEKSEIRKSIIAAESMQKSGYPVGTIREWNGKKYIKIAPGKWRPKYDSNTRGAKMAIAALKRKANSCKDSHELLQMVLENKSRFSDENGRPLPFIQELADYVSGLNDKMETLKVPTSDADKLRNQLSGFNKKEQKIRLETIAEHGGTKGKLARQILKEDYSEEIKQKFSDNAVARRNAKKEINARDKEFKEGYKAQTEAIEGKDLTFISKLLAKKNEQLEGETDTKQAARIKGGIRAIKDYAEKLNSSGYKAEEKEETEQEKHDNRSQGMKGNKNAYKGGSKDKPSTKTFKTVEELKEYASKKYGIEVTIAHKKDLPQIQESFNVIDKSLSEYPELSKYVKNIEYRSLGKKTGGDYEYKSRAIRIGSLEENPNFENFKQNAGTDIASITMHELSHAMENMIIDKGETWDKTTSKKELDKVCKDIVNEALNNLGIKPKRTKLSPRDQRFVMDYNDDTKKYNINYDKFTDAERAIAKVSLYARANDVETIPECMTDYMLNGDKAQPISKEIYKLVQERLKDKKGIEPKAANAKVIEDKINEIIGKAVANGNSRQLLNSMVLAAVKAGGKDSQEFMSKHNISTTKDLNTFIDNAMKESNADLKNVETDEDFINRVGIGKVGTVVDSKKASIDTIRNKYKASKSIKGDEDSITLPDGSELEGTWKLVEADTPTASHDETTFSKTEGFPSNEDGTTINDRDYEHDNAAKEAVLDIASDFDSRALSVDNPIVVSEDGVVISGNNRTMSSKLAAKKGTDKKYIETLEKKCKKFGFNKDDLSKFKNPRVVFETNVDGKYSTKQFAKFNQSGKKAQSPVEIAVKVSKTVNASTIENVASKMSEYDTLGELYADNKAMQDVFNSLIENKVIQKTDLPAYYTSEGGVTNNGKEFLETVLIGSVINENNIRSLSSPGGKEIRQKLVRAIVPLVENKGLKGYSITKEINEAVGIAVDIKKNKKFESVDEYAKQNVLFGEKPDPISIEFAKKLEGTQKEFAEFMKTLNGGLKPAANGEADIFLGGIETRDEVLSRYLNIKKSVWEILNSIIA